MIVTCVGVCFPAPNSPTIFWATKVSCNKWKAFKGPYLKGDNTYLAVYTPVC